MTKPAAHTRKEAIVKGWNDRKPIFAAIKLTAQITTTMPISEAMTRRLGARPLEDSTSTSSDQPFFPYGQFFNPLAPRLESDARPSWHSDGPLRRDRHFRLDNVLGPIALAGANVPRKRKVGQRRKGNVVRPPDSRLQHSTAPHRHSILLA